MVRSDSGDGEYQASTRRSGGSSIREAVKDSRWSETGGARRDRQGAGSATRSVDRSAGCQIRVDAPEPDGSAPPQGAEVQQGAEARPAGRDRAGGLVGSGFGSAGWSDTQQHFGPQFMPHLHWWPLETARPDLPAATGSASAGLPKLSPQPTIVSTATIRRRQTDPFRQERWDTGQALIATRKQEYRDQPTPSIIETTREGVKDQLGAMPCIRRGGGIPDL